MKPTRPGTATTKERVPLARGSRINLVTRVSGELRSFVGSGEYSTGDRIPSESRLAEMYGVSRTVIREAIAVLRSEGIVEARQGAGIFVTNDGPDNMLLSVRASSDSISSALEVLELRAAVEIEAAGLAAIRRSPAQEEAIFDRYVELNNAIRHDQPTPLKDIEFHLAIAEATNNPRFPSFLKMLNENMIPRAALQDSDAKETTSKDYLKHIQKEHLQVAKAISEGDPDRARQAMRIHLVGSQERYRKLLQQDRLTSELDL